jgi:hypothetical protein
MKKLIIAGVAVIGVATITTIIYKKMIKKSSNEEATTVDSQVDNESENDDTMVDEDAETDINFTEETSVESGINTHETKMNQIHEDHVNRMNQITEIQENINKIFDIIENEIKSGNFDVAKELNRIGEMISSLNTIDETKKEFKPDPVILKIIQANPELLKKYPEYKKFI